MSDRIEQVKKVVKGFRFHSGLDFAEEVGSETIESLAKQIDAIYNKEPVSPELEALKLSPEQIVAARDKGMKLVMEGKIASFLFTVCEDQLETVQPLVDHKNKRIAELEAQVKKLEQCIGDLHSDVPEVK